MTDNGEKERLAQGIFLTNKERDSKLLLSKIKAQRRRQRIEDLRTTEWLERMATHSAKTVEWPLGEGRLAVVKSIHYGVPSVMLANRFLEACQALVVVEPIFEDNRFFLEVYADWTLVEALFKKFPGGEASFWDNNALWMPPERVFGEGSTISSEQVVKYITRRWKAKGVDKG